MRDQCFGAILSVLLGCAVTAQGPASVLGVTPPIDKLRCNTYRSNDVRIDFDDKGGDHFTYLINLHFMNGDGRVYRIQEAQKRVPIGMRGEAELLRHLSAWSRANISKAERKRLSTVAPDAWARIDHRCHEVLVAIDKLKSLPSCAEVALIGKGRDFFVHALPSPPAARKTNVERIVASGIALTHTDRKSGRMRHLIDPTGTIALNTRRISYLQTRLVGLAVDGERLYAVLWRSPRLWNPPRDSEGPLPGGSFTLEVFWLADGSKVAESRLTTATIPEMAPAETIDRGPLTVEMSTVSCYGQRFRFRGKVPVPLGN